MTKTEMLEILRGKVMHESPEEIQARLNEIADELEQSERVVHGHWEECDLTDGKDVVELGYKRCSVCHDLGFLNEDGYGYWNGQTLSDYCPCCGARMDEVGE